MTPMLSSSPVFCVYWKSSCGFCKNRGFPGISMIFSGNRQNNFLVLFFFITYLRTLEWDVSDLWVRCEWLVSEMWVTCAWDVRDLWVWKVSEIGWRSGVPFWCRQWTTTTSEAAPQSTAATQYSTAALVRLLAMKPRALRNRGQVNGRGHRQQQQSPAFVGGRGIQGRRVEVPREVNVPYDSRSRQHHPPQAPRQPQPQPQPNVT
jgi:hypothetical protein